jgi:hypothetical protein
VPERRHLSLRIDGEVLGLLLVALGELEQVDVIRLAHLLQHPAHGDGARRHGVIEQQIGHDGVLSGARRYGAIEPKL